MAYVYQNIIVGDELDVGPTGAILDRTPGYLISGDGTQSVVVPVGTDGQVLTADSGSANGLAWQSAAGGLIVAGDGLSFTGDILNVGGSTTILALADTLAVNSNAVAGQPLLSSGTVGTTAAYGPLSLSTATSVTGVLPVVNGGTNTTSFAPDNLIVSNPAGDALIASGINPDNLPVQVTASTTDATPTTIHTIPTVANTAYTVTGNFLGKSAALVANFRIRATFDSNGANVVTEIGSDLVYVPLGTTWSADISVSGTNIILTVTGAAATDIDWAATVEVLTVTFTP